MDQDQDLTRPTSFRLMAGLACCLAGAGLLTIAAFAFVFFNYCEDACDKPPWSFWGALATASPFAAGAIACLVLALRLLSVRGRWARIAVASIVAAVTFVGGLVFAVHYGGAGWAMVGLVLAAAWIAGVVRVARSI